jgi:cbb3-type cytochrome oxidase subunit 3
VVEAIRDWWVIVVAVVVLVVIVAWLFGARKR